MISTGQNQNGWIQCVDMKPAARLIHELLSHRKQWCCGFDWSVFVSEVTLSLLSLCVYLYSISHTFFSATRLVPCVFSDHITRADHSVWYPHHHGCSGPSWSLPRKVFWRSGSSAVWLETYMGFLTHLCPSMTYSICGLTFLGVLTPKPPDVWAANCNRAKVLKQSVFAILYTIKCK